MQPSAARIDRPGDAGELTISAIIPTFNSGQVVGDAIASALAQSHPTLEVLVVDDGSTDSTQAILEACAPPVRYIRQVNAGPSAARNAGAKLARGQWLAFLDADDLWLPTKLAEQLDHAVRSGAHAVLTGLFWPSEGGESIVAYSGSLRRDDLIAALLSRNVLAGGASTLLVRRTAFEVAGGFDESMTAAEDREFLIRLAASCVVSVLPVPLTRRRVGPVQFGGDPERLRSHGELILKRHARLISHRPTARFTLRQARARLWQRAGLQYLARGDHRRAGSALARAAAIWPFLADPWRAALNAMLGRLPQTRRFIAPDPTSPRATTPPSNSWSPGNPERSDDLPPPRLCRIRSPHDA